MSYEREDIPALIAAFRDARALIATNEGSHFLCYVLEKVESPVQHKAMMLVQEAIGRYFTLTSWIQEKGGTKLHDSTNLRRLRILWCNKIIRDLKEYAR